MKIRHDFVSNSSSCSFVFNHWGTSIADDLVNHKNLVTSSVDCVIFTWSNDDVAKGIFQEIMEYDPIKVAIKNHGRRSIRYYSPRTDLNPPMIEIRSEIFESKDCFEFIFQKTRSADKITLHMDDTWDDFKSRRLIQLMTVLDIRGYHPIYQDGGSLEYTTLEEIEDESSI